MATTPITIRLDEEESRALELLMEGGMNKSDAIRKAILWAARERRRARLREQAVQVMSSAEDRAEARRVMEDMEGLSAW